MGRGGLAGGMLGMGLGQRKVDAAFQQMGTLDLAIRVKIVSVGTREASDALLVGGSCALLLTAVGGLVGLVDGRRA
ncbi:MAG TPA: hypothetical protein VK550_34120 [Polyangiaceae bacterium]|nr:hypothetical protein [Polyangiaceae bacterium]